MLGVWTTILVALVVHKTQLDTCWFDMSSSTAWKHNLQPKQSEQLNGDQNNVGNQPKALVTFVLSNLIDDLSRETSQVIPCYETTECFIEEGRYQGVAEQSGLIDVTKLSNISF